MRMLRIKAEPTEADIADICQGLDWTLDDYYEQLAVAYYRESAVRFDTLGFTTRPRRPFAWGTVLKELCDGMERMPYLDNGR